jgi:peptide/nickel transport system substrate-binding protein
VKKQGTSHPTVNRAGKLYERKPMRKLRMASLLALVVFVPLLVTGCGSSNKKGGTLTVLSQGDVDSLDPGYHYYSFDTQALDQTTQRTLYGWKPDERKPTPDLAAAPVAIADGGKTITVKLKSGIKFSPPVNREFTSADVKYAMERSFLPQVGNAYATVYYADIVGVDAFTKGKAKEISGIQTPDPHTLVIKTTKAIGVLTTANALTEPATAPVPKDYAQKYDKGKTSTYGDHVVGTGPYMIPNDASGKITSAGYQAGKKLVLVRNPNWDKAIDYRPAYLNRIEFLGGNDLTVATRRILKGDSLVNGDFVGPPVATLKEALTRYKDQVSITPGDSFRYIALNNTIKPFDNINVRKAVNAVIDRNALILTRGGPKVGEPAYHYIPPFMPGFQDAGGRSTPYDFLKNPNGNLALAQQYMKKAGYPSGKYSGPPLLMVGDNATPASNTGEAIQSQLQKLGFKLTYRQVPHEVANSKFCGVPKQKVAICPNEAWAKDFYDSQSEVDPEFNGKNIVQQGNVNWTQTDDPKLNAAMDKAEGLPDAASRAKAWGKIDIGVTGLAAGVPWIWDNNVNERSKNVNGVISLSNGAYDLTFTSVK